MELAYRKAWRILQVGGSGTKCAQATPIFKGSDDNMEGSC